MSPPLLTLPDELIVELLSYLHPRDIAVCQRSCRQLNDTIIHSQLLQYLIRVGRSGLYDPLFPSHTVSQRICALKKWETAWNDVEMKSFSQVKHNVACPFKLRVDCTSRIHDDFLIVTKSNVYDNPGYGYVDLRTFQSEGEGCSWTMIANHSWSDKRAHFAFSMEQDLALVALRPKQRTPSMFIELQGIRFSRGTPHPYVVGAIIPIEVNHDVFMDVVISGDRTVLSIGSSLSQRIFLHSWKDGLVHLLREASMQGRSSCLVMISRDTIARFDVTKEALEICRIVEEPDSGAPSLCTIVHLGFPPRAPDASIYYSSCIRESVPAFSAVRSLAIEGRLPKHPPFHSSPEGGLVVVVMGIEIRGTYNAIKVTIVTHLRSLMALAATRPPGVTFIPWENWGPRTTACFGLQFSTRSDIIMGERFATVCADGRTLSLFDFNSTRIQDAIRRAGNPSGRGMALTRVERRSVIPRGKLFNEDVVGELPYISLVKPAFVKWSDLANYEEGLVGLTLNNFSHENLFYVEIRSTE